MRSRAVALAAVVLAAGCGGGSASYAVGLDGNPVVIDFERTGADADRTKSAYEAGVSGGPKCSRSAETRL